MDSMVVSNELHTGPMIFLHRKMNSAMSQVPRNILIGTVLMGKLTHVFRHSDSKVFINRQISSIKELVVVGTQK